MARIGVEIILLIGVLFLVFVVSGDPLIEMTKVANLKPENNRNRMLVNISIFNFLLQAVAEFNANPRDDCDNSVIIKTDSTAIKVRMKPKGNCDDCCRITSKDIQLKLYTENKPETARMLSIKKRSPGTPNLKKYTKVIVFIHGFLEITEVGSAKILKDAYLSRNKNYAVIIVDWSELVSFPWYIDATINVQRVALALASLLEKYHDLGRVNLEKVHLIGFSLGAHVAGFVGKYLRKGLRIARITGLDPALPRFKEVTKQNRLSKDDADFVDIIHTDGSNFGLPSPIGHVDFYPNGGTYYQPGCNYKELQAKNEMYNVLSCSHQKAFYFYTESVYSPYNFPAVKCDQVNIFGLPENCNQKDMAYMGYAANESLRGIYYLKTNQDSPFGRGGFDIKHDASK